MESAAYERCKQSCRRITLADSITVCSPSNGTAHALLVLLALVVLSPVSLGHAEGHHQLARDIYETTGVKGGLIVHLGCGAGQLTAALRIHDRYLVHGLDTDPQAVAQARRHIRSRDLYGPVSVDTLHGSRLPYADNLVNLLLAEDRGAVPMAECLRVLAPNGIAYVRSGSRWTKTVKPRPDAMDEWTHHLHDAGGNAVANDRLVGPPRHLQWTAGPLWARSHGWTPSVSAMVSANGRLFYIGDEALTCVDGTVPGKWFVVARDAFNGVLLWKVPIPKWGAEEFSGTPNTGHGVTVGRFTMPPNVGKRLVAVGDTVFVTLGTTAPVTALDAATGKIQRVYAKTDRTDEILYSDGRLILALNPPEDRRGSPVEKDQTPPPAPGKRVAAVDARTGRRLWEKGPFSAIRSGRGQDPYGRLELATGHGKVFLLTSETIECIDADSGENLWQVARPPLPADAVRRLGFAGMYEYLLTVMVYHDGVVLLAQPEPNTHHTYHTMPGTLFAFNAENGQQMWKHAYGGWGHCTPPDVFVVGDNVWTHVNADTEFGSVWGNGYKALDSSKVDYRIQALDLRTGALRAELPTKDVFNVGHHHRCYRNKVTERFLLSSRRGVEFVDLATGRNYQHHWVRSGCLLGYLPCNGMLYVAPHPCSCYIATKLVGYNALAPARKPAPSIDTRLERGPAYGKALRADPAGPEDWPTYRGNGRRTGAVDVPIPAKLKMTWQANIGTRPTALVASGGRVHLAGADTHTVHALDADTGRLIWSHTTGARVNAPPTIHNGLAIFGAADGKVYCLRAADGALVWRFAAAPQQCLVTAFGQLESAWPIPGSVLIKDGKCWFAAGRSSYIDGGIHLYALDPATGKVLHHETIYNPDPTTGIAAPEPDAHRMAGLLNDIPATDGAGVFVRQMNVATSNGRSRPHVFSTGGYLDSSWFNRTFWQCGKARTSGLMVLGDDAAYGAEVYASRSRETVFKPGAGAYRLRCVPLKIAPTRDAGKTNAKRRPREPKPLWEQRIGIRVTAMVRAANTIFVAGAPDVVDPQDPEGAWQGRQGGILTAFATADGKKLTEYKLPAPPVWDGMAATPSRLFLATTNGTILSMAAD